MLKFKEIWLAFVLITLLLVLPGGCLPGQDVSGGSADKPTASTIPNLGETTAGYLEITDMAGRSVTLPDKISSVFSTSASGTVVLYTIDPSLLIGVNYEFNKEELEFILKEYGDLLSYGQGDGINREAIIAAAPDICITYGTISKATISDTDSFQKQTGIPVVMVDDSLEAAPEAYRFLGDILGRPDRCALLAAYAEKTLAFAASLNIPEKERVSVYYGNGQKSLETAPAGSPHAALLEFVGAINVAVVEGEITRRIDISAEQIIGWDPEVIILNGEPTKSISAADAVNTFKADTRYQGVRAINHDRVYAIPKYPFSWFDRPPATNRLLGIYWLADILYPDLAALDIAQYAKDFYALFYHMELSDTQLAVLLGN